MNRWKKWASDAPPGAAPGVYVLATGKPIKKVRGSDPIGILYVGESSNLARRLRLAERKGGKSGGKPTPKEFDHSVLSYLFDTAAKLEGLTLPRIVLPNEVGSGREWSSVQKLSQTLLVYTAEEEHEDFEKLLQIQHFLKFGQYPPLNARCPSIKSIYDHWQERPGKKDGWGELWKKLKVDAAWAGLTSEATRTKGKSK